MQKMNCIPNFFFEILQRFANLLLWVLWECFIMLINNDSITLQETLVPKVLKWTCRPFWLSACKKSTYLSLLLWHVVKTLHTCYLQLELSKCLTISIKIIVSIRFKFSCLPACKKINFVIHFFLKILERNANFLFWVIWACLATHF